MHGQVDARPIRLIVVCGLAWLGSCAMAPAPAPTACAPSGPPVAMIVAAAETKAYHEGFRAGERAQWRHDRPALAAAAAKPPPAPPPKPAPAPVASAQIPDPPKNIFYPAGPALPVQGSGNPF